MRPPYVLSFTWFTLHLFVIVLRGIQGCWPYAIAPCSAYEKASLANEKIYSETPLSSSDREHLLNDHFRIVYHVDALSPLVQEYFWTRPDEGRWRLVDADEKFAGGCMADKDESHRRLIFAGIADEYCFVYIEQGGVGYNTPLYLFRQNGRDMEMVWGGYVGGVPKDLKSLRAQLKKDASRGGRQ